MDSSSGLQSSQAVMENYTKSISTGNNDPSAIVGLSTTKNQFSATIKMIKAKLDMEKQVLNIITPNKVDITIWIVMYVIKPKTVQ